MGAASPDSTNLRLKIMEKKVPESKNLNLLLPGDYLHGIYIVFTTIYSAFTFY